MNETLYLQIDQNIEVSHPHVYLQDIAELTASNADILNRLRVLPVANLNPARPGRYVFSVSDLISQIQKKEPSLTITALGEPNFILTYSQNHTENPLWRFLKVALVCLLSFFGAAFSIMTFNNDVDVRKLFEQLYTQVTGTAPQGATILEISYSLGIGLGVLFFFNHFGRMKLNTDPTPMQVQMRVYEDQVNDTLIERPEYKASENK